MDGMPSNGFTGLRRTRKVRFLVISGVVLFSFFMLFTYLFYLQVISTAKYQEKAKEVASRVVTVPARRGEIYDRNRDVPLVYNVDAFAVDVVPGNTPKGEIDSIFASLADLLDMELEDVRSKVNRRYYRNYQAFEIRDGVAREKVYYLAEHIQDYPGVTWHSKPKRGYLQDGSLSHVLGYVDTITTEEIQVLYNKGYSFNAQIGKSGIERQYEDTLRGRDGRRINIVDVKGKQAREGAETEVPPVSGYDIVLTIDRRIQTLCERALGRRNGSVVVLKPATGEMLAMVSYPWFDPAIFDSEGTPSDYREFALDPESPFLNRAVQSVYPPASVFKIVLTTGILEENAFPIERTIECTGEMRLGDRVFHCWKEHGHGELALMDGLAKSCDIFFYNMGLELGPDNIVRYAHEYGLGSPTGIDLPGEVAGFIPTPEWKEQKHHMKWLGGDTLNLSIGQGWALVTPLQMANLVAMVANGGIIYKPHLLKEVRDPATGEVVRRSEPQILHSSYIDKKTFAFLEQAMRKVVTDGTGRGVITTRAVDSAGKTGTAEIGLEENYHSWYVAYAPYETDVPEERVVIVVMVEADPEGYEWWSPKACNAILQGIFGGQDYDEAAEALNLWYLKENGADQ